MMSTRILKDELLRQCYDAPVNAGFESFRSQNVDMPLTSNVRCWVGLNTKLTSEYVEINPFIGVHFMDIERMWTSLKAGKYRSKCDRAIATYSVHMGKLAPQEQIFRFSDLDDIEAGALRLSALYSDVGLKYAKSISSYEALLPHLIDRSSALGGYPERRACCLYIMTRFVDAADFVRGFLKDRQDYFEGFAAPFLECQKLKI
jgi:hypothetical protein